MTWKFSSKTRKFWSRTSKLSKAGVLKRCKENKITAPPNDWRNIRFCLNSFKNNYHRIKSSQSLIIMVLIEHLESWKYKTDEIQTSPFNLGIRKKLNQIKIPHAKSESSVTYIPLLVFSLEDSGFLFNDIRCEMRTNQVESPLIPNFDLTYKTTKIFVSLLLIFSS